MITTTMLRDPILFLLRRGLWVSLSETEAGKQCVSPPSAAAAVKNLLHHQRGLQDVFIFKDFLLDPPSRPLYDFADFPSPVSFYLAFRPSPFQAIILNDCDAVVQYTQSAGRETIMRFLLSFSFLQPSPPISASPSTHPRFANFSQSDSTSVLVGPLNFVRNATKIRGPVRQNSFHRIPRLFCSSLPPPVPSRWCTVRFGINKLLPSPPFSLSLHFPREKSRPWFQKPQQRRRGSSVVQKRKFLPSFLPLPLNPVFCSTSGLIRCRTQARRSSSTV